MNKVKWYGAILALFFVLMGAATIYSYITSRNHLPLVSLTLPETVEDGCYRVPNQAVQEKGYRHLFVVEEGGELSLTGALTLGGWNNTGSILVNHGKTTIDGNVVIEKSTLEGDSMGVIEDNGSSAELILENGTIQNHKIRGALSASIRVTEGASFTMNGGHHSGQYREYLFQRFLLPRSTAAGCKHVYHE